MKKLTTMPRVFYLVLVMLCLAADRSLAADAGRNALKSPEGTWEMISVVSDGVTVPLEAIKGGKAVLTKDTITFISPDGKEKSEYIIKLDPTKTPHAIDIISTEGNFKGETGRGIYDLRGSMLWLCQPAPANDREADCVCGSARLRIASHGAQEDRRLIGVQRTNGRLRNCTRHGCTRQAGCTTCRNNRGTR